jgi:hypothetical protein
MFTEDRASSGSLGEVQTDDRIASLIMPPLFRFVYSASGKCGRVAGQGIER